MNIEKILISGEMPKTCGECIYGSDLVFYCNAFLDWRDTIRSARPDWCPLVTEDTLQARIEELEKQLKEHMESWGEA